MPVIQGLWIFRQTKEALNVYIYCDMFEVTRRKHVSTTVAEDFCYKVWIVEAGSRDNAQTLLLRGTVPYAGSLKPKDKFSSEDLRDI
jgi:hypothetical protein